MVEEAMPSFEQALDQLLFNNPIGIEDKPVEADDERIDKFILSYGGPLQQLDVCERALERLSQVGEEVGFAILKFRSAIFDNELWRSKYQTEKEAVEKYDSEPVKALCKIGNRVRRNKAIVNIKEAWLENITQALKLENLGEACVEYIARVAKEMPYEICAQAIASVAIDRLTQKGKLGRGASINIITSDWKILKEASTEQRRLFAENLETSLAKAMEHKIDVSKLRLPNTSFTIVTSNEAEVEEREEPPRDSGDLGDPENLNGPEDSNNLEGSRETEDPNNIEDSNGTEDLNDPDDSEDSNGTEDSNDTDDSEDSDHSDRIDRLEVGKGYKDKPAPAPLRKRKRKTSPRGHRPLKRTKPHPNPRPPPTKEDTTTVRLNPCTCPARKMEHYFPSIAIVGLRTLNQKIRVLTKFHEKSNDFSDFCNVHTVQIAETLGLETKMFSTDTLADRLHKVWQHQDDVQPFMNDDSQKEWWNPHIPPHLEGDNLGVYSKQPARHTTLDPLTKDRAMEIIQQLAPDCLSTRGEEQSFVVRGFFSWIWEGLQGDIGFIKGIGHIVKQEFDMYLHHQHKDDRSPGSGRLRAMYYGLCQQLIYQDLGYYALYVALRSEHNPRLVSFPYAAKYDQPGDSTCTQDHAEEDDQGDMRIDQSGDAHVSMGNSTGRRRAILSRLVAVDDDNFYLDGIEKETWPTLTLCNAMLSAPSSTPSGDPNEPDASLYTFPPACQLRLRSPVSSALMCRVSWDDASVQQQAEILLGQDRRSAMLEIQRARVEALEQVQFEWENVQSAEMPDLPQEQQATPNLISRSSSTALHEMIDDTLDDLLSTDPRTLLSASLKGTVDDTLGNPSSANPQALPTPESRFN